MLRAERSPGIDIAFEIAVVTWVGINDAAYRSVLSGDLGLGTTPGATVTRDHDLASHVDAHPFELCIISRDTLVDINQLGRDVAIGRIGVVTR